VVWFHAADRTRQLAHRFLQRHREAAFTTALAVRRRSELADCFVGKVSRYAAAGERIRMRSLSGKLIPLLLLVAVAAVADGTPREAFVAAARSQVGITVRYDPSYRVIGYPGGDVPIRSGVCTDVIIRAMRSAFAIDLQQRVHEDMQRHFACYPQIWGLRQPDRNIDHRRVPNLQTFFQRQGWALALSDNPGEYQPGDIVTCMIPPHLPHIMVVSDRNNGRGVPLVIHNIGAGVQEEDRLFEFKMTGHYRLIGEQFADGS
jgi:uncharacterized protein YijF (DUF1287 family)